MSRPSRDFTLSTSPFSALIVPRTRTLVCAAAVELNPEARALDEGVRFPLCHPEPLAVLFRQAGLQRVEVRAIDAPTPFRDFDDYWRPFLGGQAPAPGYCMSLDETRRAALRERIQAKLPFRADGSIQLIARAWAVKGRVPTAAV